jgi:hypothetical protein
MPKFLRDDVGGLPPDATETYYTIQFKNNITGFDLNGTPSAAAPSVPIVFQETRSNPYVNPAGDYYMSVISFEVDTESVPVFICDAFVGGTNRNETLYYVTYNNTSVNITWTPEDKTAPLPPIPVPADYDNYAYYYGYTFQHFINLVNIAIASAVGMSATPPFLVLENNQLSLVGKESEWKPGTGNTLYFNTELYNLFSSLPAEKVFPNDIKFAKQYKMLFLPYPSGVNVKNVYTTLGFPLANPYLAIFSDAEFSPFPFWNPVDSIVFTTQQLTVVPELFAKPVSLGPGDTQNVGTNADSYYILADYTTDLKSGTEYKPNISYQPNAEFRLVDLYGEQPLNSLQINMFWKDKFGILHPLFLEAGGTAYIKILFRKKTFYENK